MLARNEKIGVTGYSLDTHRTKRSFARQWKWKMSPIEPREA
jgi:hypothetical protein